MYTQKRGRTASPYLIYSKTSNTLTSNIPPERKAVMKVTVKGQVTIPQQIRERLGITPNSEVEFIEEDGRVYLKKKMMRIPPTNRFRRFRGTATVKMTTDEILSLTRGEE